MPLLAVATAQFSSQSLADCMAHAACSRQGLVSLSFYSTHCDFVFSGMNLYLPLPLCNDSFAQPSLPGVGADTILFLVTACRFRVLWGNAPVVVAGGGGVRLTKCLTLQPNAICSDMISAMVYVAIPDMAVADICFTSEHVPAMIISTCGYDCICLKYIQNGYYPPPLVLPHPLSFPRGGVGDRHLLNPKFFVAARCVVVAKQPPKSAAQSIPVESGEHVQDFKVKWSRTKKIYTELVKE